MSLLRRYFSVTLSLLFSPGKFFSGMRLNAGVSLPVLYAIFTHWIAAALSYTWEGAVLRMLQGHWGDALKIWEGLSPSANELGSPGRNAPLMGPEALQAMQSLKAQALTWFWGGSSVLLSPFKTLAILGWSTLVLFVASRLLIDSSQERPVTLRGSLRIACFSRTAILWSALPVVGPAISQILVLLTTIVGLKKSYQISALRASAVALFPQLLMLAGTLVFVALVGWFLIHGFLSLFTLSA